MKKLLLSLSIIGICVLTSFISNAQCTTTDATGCVCGNGSGDCDLLPDITISWMGLSSYLGGPTEFSQSGNGSDDGKLKVSGSTPNIGLGPFNIFSTGVFICGQDTFTSYPGTCADGSSPKQLIRQRIYHKSGNNMTNWERDAAAGTYDPGNPTIHIDDWGIFTLRLQNPNILDPRRWTIVATGHKQSFCIMDYGSCSTYNGQCRDTNMVYNQGTALTDSDFPNFGLGGGSYGCSNIQQGISSGYTDIYSENLGQMYLRIPPGTCNGDYWVVYEIDPHNNFLESNELNNYTAVPITLTLQDAPGNPTASIAAESYPILCGSDSLTLTATPGYSYLWSTGDTTQTLRTVAGMYSVTVNGPCGTATSPQFEVISNPIPAAPVITSSADTICTGGTALLQATGNSIVWRDSAGVEVGTGNLFTTPALTSSTTYTAEDIASANGVSLNGGKPDNSGGGGYYTASQGLYFNVEKPLILKSVMVYANTAGDRGIQVLNSAGMLVQSGVYYLPAGQSRVNLNFELAPANDYQITVSGNPDLYRNNAGVTYPYEIQDTLSITGSTAGASYYYFFYDWEVEVNGSVCVSPQTARHIEVVTCTGISPFASNYKFSVYPNPATDEITVSADLGSPQKSLLSITDATGRELTRYTLNIPGTGFRKNIRVADFAKGIYWIILRTGDQEYHRRIIVR
ncbi:MAG: T9SS type A sorting domain-containing protein [Bacteroidia bacterium]|nr:T9SS type A sorting domain-containing protein [Bacteroidia bacterium]